VTDKSTRPPTWPEHDKLTRVKARSQAAGEFIEWLADQGWRLARHRTTEEFDANQGRPDWDKIPVVVWNPEPIDALLARWLEIDRDKLEQEKQQMLEWTRAQNRRAPGGRIR
jgi:hypothetical protein